MKYWKLILPLFFLSLLYSCIEIHEKIHFHDDGSGNANFTFAFNGFDFLLNDEENQINIDADTQPDTDELEKELRNIKGINNVEVAGEDDELMLTVAFSFDDLNALNKALSLPFNQDHKTDTVIRFFTKSGKKFIRNSTPVLSNNENDNDELKGSIGHLILENMEYTTEYSFDKPVKSFDNESAVSNNDRTVVKLKTNFYELMQDPFHLKNEIKTD